MLYGKLEDGNISKIIEEKELRETLNKVMLPEYLTTEMLLPFGYVCIEESNTDLVQTYNTRLDFNIVEKDGKYTREWFLKELGTLEAEERKKRKWKEVLEKRDKLLSESSDTQLVDNFYLVNEWRYYREVLKNIEITYDDPFLVVYPEKPKEEFDSENFEELKHYLLCKIKEITYKKFNGRPIVDTGLGFSVDGGASDLNNFISGKDIGLLIIKDSNNTLQDIRLEDYDTIIKKIRENGFMYMDKKWTLEHEVNISETLDDLKVVQVKINNWEKEK